MTCRLIDPQLGTLDLECANGYIVTAVDVSFPDVREVVSDRALANGVDDFTQYTGARAVSVALRFDQRKASSQVLRDRIAPYVSPRRRPTLVWTEPGSTDERALMLSGRNGGISIQGPRFQSAVYQWKAPSGVIRSPTSTCVEVFPTSDVEGGRSYPENFADGGRGPYNQATGVGERIVVNRGNEVGDLTATIFGPALNPTLRINGKNMVFALTLVENETIVVNTERRTILLNNDVAQSRYGASNYRSWSWDMMRLLPGENRVRVYAASGSPALLLCYYHTWI